MQAASRPASKTIKNNPNNQKQREQFAYNLKPVCISAKI
jgi:hypothetical protein